MQGVSFLLPLPRPLPLPARKRVPCASVLVAELRGCLCRASSLALSRWVSRCVWGAAADGQPTKSAGERGRGHARVRGDAGRGAGLPAHGRLPATRSAPSPPSGEETHRHRHVLLVSLCVALRTRRERAEGAEGEVLTGRRRRVRARGRGGVWKGAGREGQGAGR
eukprot:1823912-Rhodomonas_salina.1